MVLERNLFFASQAVDHARSKLSIGAQNKLWDVVSSYGASFLCVPAIRSVELPGEMTSDLKFIRAMATKAEHVGCGNCGENASVAFIYLLDRGIKPLDFMAGGRVDHAFVVIGRAASSSPGNPKTWGPEAVICDPWHDEGGAYLASEFLTRMYKGTEMTPSTVLRVD